MNDIRYGELQYLNDMFNALQKSEDDAMKNFIYEEIQKYIIKEGLIMPKNSNKTEKSSSCSDGRPLYERVQTVTLCGSSKHEDIFRYWERIFGLAGIKVFTLPLFSKSNAKDAYYYGFIGNEDILLDIHKKKIDNSDAIFVITGKDKKIGDCAQREIDYANTTKIPILTEVDAIKIWKKVMQDNKLDVEYIDNIISDMEYIPTDISSNTLDIPIDVSLWCKDLPHMNIPIDKSFLNGKSPSWKKIGKFIHDNDELWYVKIQMLPYFDDVFSLECIDIKRLKSQKNNTPKSIHDAIMKDMICASCPNRLFMTVDLLNHLSTTRKQLESCTMILIQALIYLGEASCFTGEFKFEDGIEQNTTIRFN